MFLRAGTRYEFSLLKTLTNPEISLMITDRYIFPVANGMTTEDIIKEYPDLEPEDIKEALRLCCTVNWLKK